MFLISDRYAIHSLLCSLQRYAMPSLKLHVRRRRTHCHYAPTPPENQSTIQPGQPTAYCAYWAGHTFHRLLQACEREAPLQLVPGNQRLLWRLIVHCREHEWGRVCHQSRRHSLWSWSDHLPSCGVGQILRRQVAHRWQEMLCGLDCMAAPSRRDLQE
jgi:hypothetical protein